MKYIIQAYDDGKEVLHTSKSTLEDILIILKAIFKNQHAKVICTREDAYLKKLKHSNTTIHGTGKPGL